MVLLKVAVYFPCLIHDDRTVASISTSFTMTNAHSGESGQWDCHESGHRSGDSGQW